MPAFVGAFTDLNRRVYTAFRWTKDGAFERLGPLNGKWQSEAWDVSDNGERLVGEADTRFSTGAFLWDPEHGMRDLQKVFAEDYGLDLTGWRLTRASAISGDGDTIAGYGVNPDGNTEAWIAHIGRGGRGDLNCDADVNFDDIDPFVLALTDPDEYNAQYGETCDIKYADINADGIVDFDDIDPFVECLISGGCP